MRALPAGKAPAMTVVDYSRIDSGLGGPPTNNLRA